MRRHNVAALRRAPRVVELRRGDDDEVQDQHRQDDVEEEAVEERSLGGPLPRGAGAVHGSAAVRDIGLLVVELLSSSSSPHANAVVVWMGRAASKSQWWMTTSF